MFRDFAASVAEVSPGRVGILLLVEANPGVTQSRLAQAVPSTARPWSACSTRWKRARLVERRRGDDRRTNGLWLTRAAGALAGREIEASASSGTSAASRRA